MKSSDDVTTGTFDFIMNCPKEYIAQSSVEDNPSCQIRSNEMSTIYALYILCSTGINWSPDSCVLHFMSIICVVFRVAIY